MPMFPLEVEVDEIACMMKACGQVKATQTPISIELIEEVFVVKRQRIPAGWEPFGISGLSGYICPECKVALFGKIKEDVKDVEIPAQADAVEPQ